MDGRKKQRKKVPIRAGNFGSAQVVDRKEQHKEDYIDWLLFWTIPRKIERLKKLCESIRDDAALPSLHPDTDLIHKSNAHDYGCFMPKSFHLGTSSSYLYDHPDTEAVIETRIHKDILVPFRWSYNFYPFIEYIILYGNKPDNIFYANPCLFELFKISPREIFRGGVSTSDIHFLRERIKTFFISGKKATKEETKMVEKYNKLIDQFSLRRKHLPKNVAFKVCAFTIFYDMTGTYDRKYYKDEIEILEDDDRKRFLKNQIKDFKIEYKKLRSSGLPLKPKLSDRTVHNALKKLHLEYLKLSTK